jgi:hypothetical protein
MLLTSKMCLDGIAGRSVRSRTGRDSSLLRFSTAIRATREEAREFQSIYQKTDFQRFARTQRKDRLRLIVTRTVLHYMVILYGCSNWLGGENSPVSRSHAKPRSTSGRLRIADIELICLSLKMRRSIQRCADM